MWYVILAIITAIYLILNVFIPSGGMIEAYIIRPTLWIILAVATYLIAKNEGLNILKFKKVRRWYLGKTPIHAGLLIGGFQVSILILIGIFFGFGKSPYSFTPFYIMLNLFFVISLVLGMETSRAYLIKKATNATRKYTTIILVLITLLYVFIRLTPNELTALNLSQPEPLLEFLGNVLIVSIAMNLLASYLAYLGGATASMAYMGVLLGFEWFSPILPNLHWTLMALVGTTAPALAFIILNDTVQPFMDTRKKFRGRRKKPSDHGWTLVAIFSVIIIFFSYGYLGVEPTVIYSGSMQPTYEVGDMVIVDDIDPTNIKEGDIIQFVREDQAILLHRVVETYEEDGQIWYIVKGDANDEPDPDPVHPKQITGKAIYNIPKIGWIQIYVKEFFRKITSPIR